MSAVLFSDPVDIDTTAAQFLRLMADPTRRRIFLVLMRGEVCNCELADQLCLPQNLVSHHLRRLREAGFLREHRDPHDGRWTHYTVDRESLTEVWGVLSKAFDPARAGNQAPACGVRTMRAKT